jgi:hypothetical protein
LGYICSHTGDFARLRELRGAAGRAFAGRGVRYGDERLPPFDDKLRAVPFGVLWAGVAAGRW